MASTEVQMFPAWSHRVLPSYVPGCLFAGSGARKGNCVCRLAQPPTGRNPRLHCRLEGRAAWCSAAQCLSSVALFFARFFDMAFRSMPRLRLALVVVCSLFDRLSQPPRVWRSAFCDAAERCRSPLVNGRPVDSAAKLDGRQNQRAVAHTEPNTARSLGSIVMNIET